MLMDEADKGLDGVVSVSRMIESRLGTDRNMCGSQPIPFKPSSLRSDRDNPLIRLHLPYPRGRDTIVLRASNIREAKAWQDAILDAGCKAREGIRNVVGTW